MTEHNINKIGASEIASKIKNKKIDRNKVTEPIEKLLPHQGKMIFLDELVSAEAGSGHARVSLAKLADFKDRDQLPSYLSIECMVQTVSAMAGWRRLQQGLQPLIGLVIGARDCRFESRQLPSEGTLDVYVEMLLMEGGLGVFDAEVCFGDEVLAAGQIKAIQPESEAELRELTKEAD